MFINLVTLKDICKMNNLTEVIRAADIEEMQNQKNWMHHLLFPNDPIQPCKIDKLADMLGEIEEILHPQATKKEK